MKRDRQTAFWIGTGAVAAVMGICVALWELDAVFILFWFLAPFLVFCLLNVIFDLFFARNHRSDSGIRYSATAKWLSLIAATVIDMVIAAVLWGTGGDGNWGVLIVTVVLSVGLLACNLAFSIGMKVGWLRGIPLVVLSVPLFWYGSLTLSSLF